ncbi:MAG: hypothetical protein KAG66_04275 [Methylococcales bacterium]|nr:hypothetical protein [Methylococcales bacterium]
MQNLSYIQFLRYARRVTRRADEAEDLLQTVLLAAVESGRVDMGRVANRRWLIGALRKRALFDARSAIRRRAREASVAVTESYSRESEALPTHFVATLPPSLRITALLALSGHTKAEISYLLRVSDSTLRQRIAQIRKRWRRINGHGFAEFPGLCGTLSFGRIRHALLRPVRHDRALLASHDPDGHLFVVCSQNHVARQQQDVDSTNSEE